MTLQVIGAGFPRTGTNSMKVALEHLGLGPCHHMFEVLASPELARRWGGAASGPMGGADWAGLLAGWRSGVDWPVSFFWRELAAAFPEAKILLTVRDPDDWYSSMRATIFRQAQEEAGDRANEGMPDHLRALDPLIDRMWTACFGGRADHVPDRRTAVAAFEGHNARVRAEVPRERLLVYSTGEGWERLCGFLGVEVPGFPFPHLNDTAAMRRTQERLRRGSLPVVSARP
jgi:hypothetical protein